MKLIKLVIPLMVLGASSFGNPQISANNNKNNTPREIYKVEKSVAVISKGLEYNEVTREYSRRR
jgi:hypothetical protein